MSWAARYQAVLDVCTPYVITHRANLGSLDLAPWGVEVPEAHRYDPTRLSTLAISDRLHRLDRFSFGGQDMLMPRWVMYDCGTFPGIVFGFGRRARELRPMVRRAYRVEHDDDAFVPLSMWIAVPCGEPGAWFGHNLASVNILMGESPLPGLGRLTKGIGVALTRATRQYGATQWTSRSLHVHLTLGPLELLSAYTPAHTHPATLTYRLEVDDSIRQGFTPGWERPRRRVDRELATDDTQALQKLHLELETGASWRLDWTAHRDDGGTVAQLRRGPLLPAAR